MTNTPPDLDAPNPPSGAPIDDDSKRAAWLIPAAGGLVAGLILALVVVLLFRSEVEAPVTTDVTTIAAETTIDPSISGQDPIEATVAPETTLTSETVPEPAATVTPDTAAAPAAPDPPANSEEVGIPVAAPGTVLLQGEEFPIVRVCASSPFPGLQITSYLFFDAAGFPEIVEVTSDEGSAPFGTYQGDGEVVADFGDDGFGFYFYEGDGPGVPISVNTESPGDTCPGSVELTDPTNPDFPIRHLIVDVCFGSNRDGFGYRARLQEGGEFTANPNAGAGLALFYTSPFFGGDDPEATVSGGGSDTRIDGRLVGNPDGLSAGQTREFAASLTDSQVRDCTDVD